MAKFALLVAVASLPLLAWQQPETQTQTPPSTASQRPPTTAQPPASTKKKTKKHSRKKTKTKKTKRVRKQQTDDPGAPRRVVVRNGGTGDSGGQLQPGSPSRDAVHDRKDTDQLLQSTDANLKNVTARKLTSQQQDMVRQIIFYMDQSRSANKEGDLERAHNLALKAHMLSDELVRH